MKKLSVLDFFNVDLGVTSMPYKKAFFRTIVLILVMQSATILAGVTALGVTISLSLALFTIWLTRKMGFKFIKSRLLTIKEWIVIVGVFLALLAFRYLYVSLTFSENASEQSSITELSGASAFVIIVSLAILPAIIEEYVFRGYILGVIFKNHLLIGIILSSVPFVLLHESSNLLGYIQFLIPSIALSIAYVKTKNLLVPIMIHFLNNGAAALLIIFS